MRRNPNKPVADPIAQKRIDEIRAEFRRHHDQAFLPEPTPAPAKKVPKTKFECPSGTFTPGQAYASPDDVGTFFGVCGRTIKEKVKAGELRGIQLGSHTLRVDLQSVKELIENSAIDGAWRK